jgi:hypothetical protein
LPGAALIRRAERRAERDLVKGPAVGSRCDRGSPESEEVDLAVTESCTQVQVPNAGAKQHRYTRTGAHQADREPEKVLVNGLVGTGWTSGLRLLCERSEVRILPRAPNVLVEA